MTEVFIPEDLSAVVARIGLSFNAALLSHTSQGVCGEEPSVDVLVVCNDRLESIRFSNRIKPNAVYYPAAASSV